MVVGEAGDERVRVQRLGYVPEGLVVGAVVGIGNAAASVVMPLDAIESESGPQCSDTAAAA